MAQENQDTKQDTKRGKGATAKAEATPATEPTRTKAASRQKGATSKKDATPEKVATGKPTPGREPGGAAGGAHGPATRTPEPATQRNPRRQPKEEPFAENPIHRKLGLRSGTIGLVVAPPEDDDNPLLPLPDGFRMLTDADAVSSFEGQVDYLHFFARNRGELARVLASLRDKLAPGGSLWISWIKQSSSRRGEGLQGDLNENVIRRLALTSGLVDVKVAALDHDWSALKLVRRKH